MDKCHEASLPFVSKSFIDVHLRLNCAIHYFLYFNFHSFPFNTICWWDCSFPLCVFGNFTEDWLTVNAWIYLWALSSLYWFFILPFKFYGLAGYFGIMNSIVPGFILFTQYYFHYFRDFVVPSQFWNFFFYFSEKCHWNLERNFIKSVHHSEQMNILTTSIISIHENKMFIFCLLISFIPIIHFFISLKICITIYYHKNKRTNQRLGKIFSQDPWAYLKKGISYKGLHLKYTKL